MLIRFMRFNAVGALGILVQLASVGVLVGVLGIHYLVGSALAIEISVLHNFAWHERWTWKDRRRGGVARASTHQGDGARLRASSARSVLFRCLAFHAGNGCVSMLGSLALLPFLVGGLHLHYLPANLVTIAATGVLNFLISDRLVFSAAEQRRQATTGE